MKMQPLRFRFGNKGFIFAIDILLAVFVIAAVLMLSSFYLLKANEDPYSRLHASRIGSDIINSIDNSGVLQTLSPASIDSEINRLITINHEMQIKISCANSSQIIIETSPEQPINRFITKGERFFVTTDNYCIAEYKTWLK